MEKVLDHIDQYSCITDFKHKLYLYNIVPDDMNIICSNPIITSSIRNDDLNVIIVLTVNKYTCKDYPTLITHIKDQYNFNAIVEYEEKKYVLRMATAIIHIDLSDNNTKFTTFISELIMLEFPELKEKTHKNIILFTTDVLEKIYDKIVI